MEQSTVESQPMTCCDLENLLQFIQPFFLILYGFRNNHRRSVILNCKYFGCFVHVADCLLSFFTITIAQPQTKAATMPPLEDNMAYHLLDEKLMRPSNLPIRAILHQIPCGICSPACFGFGCCPKKNLKRRMEFFKGNFGIHMAFQSLWTMTVVCIPYLLRKMVRNPCVCCRSALFLSF